MTAMCPRTCPRTFQGRGHGMSAGREEEKRGEDNTLSLSAFAPRYCARVRSERG